MMEDDNRFLMTQGQDTTYQLTVEDRIKVLKQECAGLVEHTELILQDCQLLRQDFEVTMAQQRAI
jgi:hypothetical protein